MPKRKTEKYAQIKTFPNVLEPDIKINLENDFEFKGNWNSNYFKNSNPIILELGCGKGEYTIGLAEKFPEKNFIGIDIKGARIWRGSKIATEKNLKNVVFLRTKIDIINSFFAENEIDEIWITFPDPQPTKQNKRLSSAYFLKLYQKILKNKGIIHLKTDSRLLHFYTVKLLKTNNIDPIFISDNLYSSFYEDNILDIKTHYEQIFLDQGKDITYLKFTLNNKIDLIEIEKFTENDISH
jgi:tRNA (guanine-N7-)-methyltransferase